MALHYTISPISDTTSLIIWPITSNLVFYFTRNINNGFKFVVGEASPQYVVNSFNNLRYKNLSTEFLFIHLIWFIFFIGQVCLETEKTWLQYECDRWGLKFNLESKFYF